MSSRTRSSPERAASRSWLSSRHLRESDKGAHAIELLETLDEDTREHILGRSDELAAQSVNLAHVFFSAAVAARHALGQGYREWEEAGFRLLGEDGSGRDAAQAFFGLDARAIGAMAAATRSAWLDVAAGLLATSRRLASSFITATGASLCEHPDLDAARIGAWQEGTKTVLAHGGWRGEFVASALIESTAQLLPLLDARGVAAWSRLLVVAGSAGRSPRVPQPPATLAGLSENMRTEVLELTADLADSDRGAALAVLESLPHAVACLPPAAADNLLEALRGNASRAGVSEAVAMVPAVTHGMAAADIETVFASVPELAELFPEGLAPFLRTVDRALEEGGLGGAELWIERGLDIGAHNREAGVAHFRLESRTSHKILVQHSTAVTFDEVEGLLQRYIVMMSRRPFQLVNASGIWYRPPLIAPEDTAVRLPELVDLCETSEDNQVFYKLNVAHIAGRWEYGTYDFEMAEFERLGWSVATGEPAERSDIIGLLDSFPNPLLAAALFVLLDGARVDAALARDFPGLRPELDRMGQFYAANPPVAAQDRHSERLLEALFMMSVGRLGADELAPRLRAQGHALSSSLEVLRSPEATVYDSAALLLAYYGSLTLAEVAVGEEEGAVPILSEIGGATVIDPFEHLDGDGPVMPGGAGEGPPGEQLSPDGRIEDGSLELELADEDGSLPPGGLPLSAEEIRELLESGADIEIVEEHGEIGEGLGLYITDLLGKLPAEAIKELRERLSAGDASSVRAWLKSHSAGDHCVYDEWDHLIGDYRRKWCRLYEVEAAGDAGKYFSRVISRSADLVQNVRREFQMMRPEQFRKVRGMQDGEDFDLNALVEAHADRRTRRAPSERLYVARRREERDVATLFLVDMSASTDEPLANPGEDGEQRRVIDLTKDTMVIVSAVLDEIGDAYAIYGFSGHGRENVEYYHVKAFSESLNEAVRSRLGGIEPKRSTRMGAALRHSAGKLGRVTARARHLILLSDGFPQDYDYGEDRRSNVYGIRDTTKALQELEKEGIHTFCITVDPAGHDYLGDMCPSSRYAVIENIEELPAELPRIYRQVTRA